MLIDNIRAEGRTKPFTYRSQIKMETVPDECPDLSWLEQDYHDVEDEDERQRYVEQGAERLANYGRTWSMIGVRAKATVYVPQGFGGSCSLHLIETPGLWGVEDDSGDDHLEDIFADELDQLEETLSAMNVEIIEDNQ